MNGNAASSLIFKTIALENTFKWKTTEISQSRTTSNYVKKRLTVNSVEYFDDIHPVMSLHLRAQNTDLTFGHSPFAVVSESCHRCITITMRPLFAGVLPFDAKPVQFCFDYIFLFYCNLYQTIIFLLVFKFEYTIIILSVCVWVWLSFEYRLLA